MLCKHYRITSLQYNKLQTNSWELSLRNVTVLGSNPSSVAYSCKPWQVIYALWTIFFPLLAPSPLSLLYISVSSPGFQGAQGKVSLLCWFLLLFHFTQETDLEEASVHNKNCYKATNTFWVLCARLFSINSLQVCFITLYINKKHQRKRMENKMQKNDIFCCMEIICQWSKYEKKKK